MQNRPDQGHLPSAGEFMHRHPHVVPPELALERVVEFLNEHAISNAPVVEERDHRRVLLGFISERDCLKYLVDDFYFGSPRPVHTAATIMRRHPVCVSPETDGLAVASIFINHDFRHLPVVEDGLLLGIVSRRDVLHAMARYIALEDAHQVRRRHPPDVHQLVNQRFIVSAE
jgi:CBS domain-containing protein